MRLMYCRWRFRNGSQRMRHTGNGSNQAARAERHLSYEINDLRKYVVDAGMDVMLARPDFAA
jgi:hypothetical protein